MLFYTVMFVACLVATLIVSFLYKAVAQNARMADASYERITTTSDSRDYQRKRAPTKTCKSFATNTVPELEMVFSKWSRMSPDGLLPCLNQDTSWVVREKRLLSMCESYAARRSNESKPMTLDMISKPFRRKVSL